jgi:hypothetical protein
VYQFSPRTVTGRHLVPPPSRSQSSIYFRYGLGDTQDTGKVATADAQAIAGGTLTTLQAVGISSTAIPIIGAAICAVTLVLGLLFSRKGPKQKVATTSVANKVEPALQQNLAAYLAGPRTVSSQKQALANFDAGWAYLVEYCDTPTMGDPGKKCVSDRQSGACTWKATAGAWTTDSTTGESRWTPAGAAGSGNDCWNWFVGYRDPIANDPGVIPDPVYDASGNLVTTVTDPTTGVVTTVPYTGSGTGTGLSLSPTLLLALAALGLVFILPSSGGRS